MERISSPAENQSTSQGELCSLQSVLQLYICGALLLVIWKKCTAVIE
jgi:hypothetical protein